MSHISRLALPSALVAVLCTCAVSVASPDAVGVYDENTAQPNIVDFTATGSGVSFGAFQAAIPGAFAAGRGGVVNCETFTGDRGYTYAATTKEFFLLEAPGSSYGIGGPSIESTPVSGTGAFAGSPPDFHGVAWNVSITGAAPGEAIYQIGLTVLSKSRQGTPVNFGNVTATALLSGGGTVSASRPISEAIGQGDTFFGLVAPLGQSIVQVTVRNDSTSPFQSFMWVDEIGFITTPIPEPASLGACGVVLAAAATRASRRRRAQRP